MQQQLLMASDILIEITWLKVPFLELKMAKKEGEDKIQEQIAMAKLYLYQAVDVVTLKRKRKHYPLLKVTNNVLMLF
jgi:hypothetical protein